MRNIHIYIVTFIFVATSIFSVDNVVAQSYSVPEAVVDLDSKSEDELWDMANTAYANDDFVGAMEYYNAIFERDVHSASLYYNLGNAHYKMGEIALSLLNYYRALRLDPSDADIRYNIDVAKSKTSDNIEQIPRFFVIEWSEWLGSRLSCMQWSLLSLITLAVLFSFVLLYLLAGGYKLRRVGFWSGVVALILFILTTRYALIERSELLNPSDAVIMSSSLSVKSSPSSSSTELFILHEGTRVEVQNRHDSWSEIVISDGKKGWVESSKIEQI